ncbi:MAG: hypothetical protein JEY71_16540 [Sphaerochaeta sp.]|nr:hypothetical protein [Sphaerochaeta sp.]
MQNTFSYQVPQADKKFELSGWPLPSDEIQLHFDSDLEESNMFEVFGDEDTEAQFTGITKGAFFTEINTYGHIQFVENLFDDNFDEDIAFILMNAFFWIFYYKRDTWAPVRSYAIEMLKLFPEAILKQYPIPEDFIQAFSTFTKNILSKRGICSLKTSPTPYEVKKGTYAIRSTDAFQYLLQPSEYVIATTLAE